MDGESPEDEKFLEDLQRLIINGRESEKSQKQDIQNDDIEEEAEEEEEVEEKLTVIPTEQKIENAERVEPLKSVVPPEYVKKVIKEMDSMSTEMLKQALLKIKLSTGGNKKTLRKRVAQYYRKENMLLNRKLEPNSDKTSRFFDYLIAIDFECTCVEVIYDYPHEIIELPAVLIDVREMKIVSEFRTYVRPVKNPILSEFCIQFTKITQETVDNAPYFREALLRLYTWMRKFGLGEKDVRFAFVTDGPHDMWKFMQFQCLLSSIRMPHMFRSFINIKKTFSDKFTLVKGNGKSGIENMLEKLGLTFRGNKHSGLDDARNIAAIAIEMMKMKIELRINERCSYKMLAPRKINPQADASHRDFQEWMRRLPLKLLGVTRKEFMNEEYLDCESCDDLTDDKNDDVTVAAKMRIREELGDDEEFERICEQKGRFEIGEIRQAHSVEPIRRRNHDRDESDSSGDEADSELVSTVASTREEGPDLNTIWSTEHAESTRNDGIDSTLPVAHSVSSDSAGPSQHLAHMTMSPPRSYDHYGPPRNSLASSNRRHHY